ncbi:hypothetical protein F2Q69_00056016 [Brassica cretica]|uniref:Disease resistance protein n=1 Tax=Brassica cretica TaxID=69181 RepID=A0A8S9MWR0_BRACR|nr:hypothetical protein F2Q69_00056016 [Brassica cretica]
MAEVVVSAMVEGVVSFGVEKLWDLLSRESERLQGVHEHVAGLKRRMRTLQSLLKDADAKKHENEVVRNFLEDVKDIVYDAEDIIESFLLKESSGDKKGIKRRVKGLSCFLVERRDISIDIEGITKRMSEVVTDMQSFGIKEIMNDGRSLSLKERQRVQREIRQTFPKGSEKGLVGVEESVEELVGHLVENDNIQVVSISGMGGIGKTTLARQVFHHDIVRRHFDGFAWVCVSKEFRRKDIWQKILQDLKLHGKDIKQMDENELQTIKQMDENELQEKLFLLMGTRRHLIVIDDVWKNEDWDRIKDVFPQERGKLFNCWKMILTSRDEGVGLHADPTCFAFIPTILTPEESWELCEQIALSRRDKTVMAEVVVSAMVEGVVSFGVEKLWDLLSRETERLQGVHEHVAGLKRRMRTLQSLLKDADAKKHENEVVRNFLEDVKDIVYDAEDIIESFVLKESSGDEKGIKRRVKGLSCFLVERRDISIDIEGITKRMSEVVADMQSFGIKEIMNDGRSLSLKERQRVQREIRQTFPKSSEKGLVGVEESVEELVGHLVENDNIQVVSISGMGGIGKTTLARQVFHHDIVRRHFDGFAWVCVSKEFQRKDIWQKILQDLRPHDENIKEMDENKLQAELFLLLGTSRHLIVIDDVWKNEDWDRIKDVFPQERGKLFNCWKMILTSRDEGVGLHADPTCFAFTPKILTPEESWELCEQIALSRRDKTDDNKQDSVYRVLYLSYEDLPMHLKHCFLCLAYFPEDYKIRVDRLYYLWAAEGIITSSCDEPTIQESGEEYLEELVRRNMVIVEKNIRSWGWDYCQMHDMMRGVCLHEAKKENFLQVIKAPTTSTSTVNAHTRRSRRLAVHGGNALNVLGCKSNKKARSVLGFEPDGNLLKQSAQGFQNLQLLRVLDLREAKFGGRIPSGIGKLIHLRFLSLCMIYISHIPSSLRNLKLLLYLKLVSMADVHVPNIFKEMVELRYLWLPPFMDDKTKLELGNLVNLESLWGFNSENCSITDLRSMTRLRTLEVILKGRYTSENLASSVLELRNLETLRLIHRRFNQPDVPFEVDFIWNFIHLRDLDMWMHMTRLPEHSRFPPNLASISLSECRMEEDPLPILEKLLHLQSVELSYSAFVGRKMVCSKGGFPQLRKLNLMVLKELEEWVIEEGSMPCLRTLYIQRCDKLKEIPEGLKYIISLKELKISGMKNEWKEKLESGGESYYKVQHIPSVQFNYDSHESEG